MEALKIKKKNDTKNETNIMSHHSGTAIRRAYLESSYYPHFLFQVYICRKEKMFHPGYETTSILMSFFSILWQRNQLSKKMFMKKFDKNLEM